MRLRGTSEWGAGGESGGRQSDWRPSWGERNMCLQKEDISFGDVYRLLPTTDRRTGAGAGGRRQHTNSARGQLSSGSTLAHACIQTKKLALHPLLFVPPALHSLHPPNFLLFLPPSLPPFVLSLSPRPFLILTWPSVRVRASFRPSVGIRQRKPGQVLAVCRPLKRPHSLTHTR